MTQNDHPEELLAGYVDGSLRDGDRVAVERHLATCARCREESALAMRSLSSLRALPEEPVPLGVMTPVWGEIGHRIARPVKRPLSQRVLWAAGGAVAAAFIAVVAASVLPRLGTTGGTMGEAAAPATSSPPAVSKAAGANGGNSVTQRLIPLERSATNYDQQSLAALAVHVAQQTSISALAGSDLSHPATAPASTAAACLDKGVDVAPQDRLVRLIQARFEGQPAYIGVYLTGPAADRPANSVLIWVVSSKDCVGILSFTSKKL